MILLIKSGTIKYYEFLESLIKSEELEEYIF